MPKVDIDTLQIVETMQGEDESKLSQRLAWYESFLTVDVSEDEKEWADGRIELCQEEMARRK